MSKKAVLLHATNGSSRSSWFPWLKEQLEELGWSVWTPDLPMAHEPDTIRYNQYLAAKAPWAMDDDTVLVGHSSGSLAALGFLQDAKSVHVATCVLIGAFIDDLGWPNLGGLFKRPYDFDSLRTAADRYVIIHSDDDPYCPLVHAEVLADRLHGTLVVQSGQGHFSAETEPPYTEFPYLLRLLEDDSVRRSV